jgi:hypothetical protein
MDEEEIIEIIANLIADGEFETPQNLVAFINEHSDKLMELLDEND